MYELKNGQIKFEGHKKSYKTMKNKPRNDLQEEIQPKDQKRIRLQKPCKGTTTDFKITETID